MDSPGNKENIYELYFPNIDNFGGNGKNADPFDGDSKFLYTYFNAMQSLYNQEKEQELYHDGKQPMYVGRTKAWQTIPDFYGKDQVDKVQAAIGAPLQDQLDGWEQENMDKFIKMPVTNENIHKFRDAPDYHDSLDHDYERIIYERSKSQKYEQLRNTRYGELLEMYQKNNFSYLGWLLVVRYGIIKGEYISDNDIWFYIVRYYIIG